MLSTSANKVRSGGMDMKTGGNLNSVNFAVFNFLPVFMSTAPEMLKENIYRIYGIILYILWNRSIEADERL